MVLDKGLSRSEVESLLDSSASFIDYLKFGWATTAVAPHTEAKIEMLKAAEISVCLGGTFFELAHVHSVVDDYLDRAEQLGFDYVEISDGTISLEHSQKLDYIAQAAERFVVLSEYGSKDDAQISAPRLWVEGMQQELRAGAWKVIAEGRESGTAGLYRTSAEIRGGLVDEIVHDIDPDDVLWEAPLKAHQTWLIQRFGANVNLGNIAPNQVVAVETLRLGLRSDTLLHFHGDN